MKDDRLYLIHIRDCLSRIRQYTREGQRTFLASTLIQDAVIRNLQTLTESSQRLSLSLKNQHPEIDWQGMAGFRNVLVHDYLGVDVLRVWKIVNGDLPHLKRLMQPLLKGLAKQPSSKGKKSVARSQGRKKKKK
jgi:uncharacterized protein with HEPN domain